MPHATIIAIDGPAASGKTTVGKILAEQLGFQFLDTGMMYRAITLIALEQNINITDEESLSKAAERTSFTFSQIVQGQLPILLTDSEDISARLFSDYVDRFVSQVSTMPRVRHELVIKQRALAAMNHIVMVGRDIGTVVLPNAQIKVFLDASPEVRAKRRSSDRIRTDLATNPKSVESTLKSRDRIDANRTISPLLQSPDAVRIETDYLSIEQVVQSILTLMTPE